MTLALSRCFPRQIQGIGHSSDWLVALSTSGTSSNILNAIRQSCSMGISCLFLTSISCELPEQDGLTLIKVHSSDTARIQEVHEILGHLLCSNIQMNMLKNR